LDETRYAFREKLIATFVKAKENFQKIYCREKQKRKANAEKKRKNNKAVLGPEWLAGKATIFCHPFLRYHNLSTMRIRQICCANGRGHHGSLHANGHVHACGMRR
jgi:hypothetical protein